MNYLIDTNVLLRSAQPEDALYSVATDVVEKLLNDGHALYITPQNVAEFWNSATRPKINNGLGMTPQQAEDEVRRLETILLLAPDDPTIYIEWRRIVLDKNVCGVLVHDARLVAAMKVHGITHVLTFNARDFARFDDIVVVVPSSIQIS